MTFVSEVNQNYRIIFIRKKANKFGCWFLNWNRTNSANNRLTGKIPSEIGNLEEVRVFNLGEMMMMNVYMNFQIASYFIE